MAIGDVSTGVAAAMAVGFALLNAERTGTGQYLDASLLDTYFHMHELAVPVISHSQGKVLAAAQRLAASDRQSVRRVSSVPAATS